MVDPLALITTFGIALAAFAAVASAWFSYLDRRENRANRIANQIANTENKAAVREVHLLINSRMDELLKASRSEGAAEARADDKLAQAKAAAMAADRMTGRGADD